MAGGEMIPPALTREHVLAAIDRIERQGIPAGRSSRGCELRYSGHRYPPKLVISVVVWLKFAAMAEGARLATRQLWGRA